MAVGYPQSRFCPPHQSNQDSSSRLGRDYLLHYYYYPWNHLKFEGEETGLVEFRLHLLGRKIGRKLLKRNRGSLWTETEKKNTNEVN